MKTASEILLIKSPEKIFTNDRIKAKKEFHDLSKKWHPDTSHDPQSSEVFSHINSLYHSAVEKMDSNTWGESNVFRFTDGAGVKYSMAYQRERLFELGKYYVAEDKVVYVFDPTHRRLAEAGVSWIKSFRYPGLSVKEEISKYLPTDFTTYEMSNQTLVLKVRKSPDLLSLRDVLEFYGGSLDPRHVAWIQNRLHNLACYLYVTLATHNEISLDTVFISPKDHYVALLGGWGYSVTAGKTIKQVPRRTADLLPWGVRKSKEACFSTDQELIRAIGRELLGDILGRNMKAPKEMQDFLKSVSSKDPIKEYKSWGETIKCLGPRKFHRMELNSTSLYQ